MLKYDLMTLINTYQDNIQNKRSCHSIYPTEQKIYALNIPYPPQKKKKQGHKQIKKKPTKGINSKIMNGIVIHG